MNPSLSQLQKYAVVDPSSTEAIKQSYYDFLLYPTAGQTSLQFFALPIGQGTTSSTAATGTKSYADTNMQLAGQFPAFLQYLLDSIEIYFEPGSVSTANVFTKASPGQFNATASAGVVNNVNDMDSIRQTGWLEFKVVEKVYLREAPLGRFPTKSFLEVDAAISSNSTTAAGAVVVASPKLAGRPYYVEPNIAIPSNAAFSVTMQWPAAIATPSGFNARIGVVMEGVLFRATQ